jgi:hypothetical protein
MPRAPNPLSGETIMIIRKMTLGILAVLALALGPVAFGQIGNQARPSNLQLGYYDPTTGVFQPLQAAPDAEAAAVAPTTGTLTMKYTITVDSTIPKNGVISCTGLAYVSESSGVWQEHGTGIATLASGKTYNCSVIIHYSWLLASASTDKISFTGGAQLLYGLQVTATNGTATVVQPVPQRESDPAIPPIKVPANGASTTVSISPTL